MRFKYDEENRFIINNGPQTTMYFVRLFDNETDEILDFLLDSEDDISPNKKRWNEWLVEWPLRASTYDYFVFEKQEDPDSTWILALGFWNDEGEWIDQAIWYDSFTDTFTVADPVDSGLLTVYKEGNITPGTQSFLQPYVPSAIIDGVDDFQEYN
jgi:hypothetical protein